MASSTPTSITLVQQRARQLKALRAKVFARLFPNPPGTPNPITQIANTFTRYASTQATAYDNGAVNSGAAGGAGLLSRQVERAMAQVLGGAPGRGADSFMNA